MNNKSNYKHKELKTIQIQILSVRNLEGKYATKYVGKKKTHTLKQCKGDFVVVAKNKPSTL